MATDFDGVLKQLTEDGIEQLWVVYHDYLGRAQGKMIPKSSFASAVRSGVVFAKANLDFDHHDHQVEGASYLADSGDFLALPDPESYAVLHQFPATAQMYAYMRDDGGDEWPGCPRTQLAKLLDSARELGYSFAAALEPEFYILRSDAFAPTNATSMFSTAGMAMEEGVLRRIVELLEARGVRVPQIGKEYSAGQYELSTYHGDPMSAVNNYYAVRESVRDAVREFGYSATFMPKPFADWSGNSLHVHLSIWDAAGATDMTPGGDDEVGLSETGRFFIGGLLHHVRALTGLGSPTVNSYKRLQPGSWAPANTYWGYGNRSGVVRVPGTGSRRHIEYRASDNSAQPELLMIGLIAAGLDGIVRKLEPGDAFQQDIGHMTSAEIKAANLGTLPRTLGEALDALAEDDVVCNAIGSEITEHFLKIRRHEHAQYELVVHEWERETYGPVS